MIQSLPIFDETRRFSFPLPAVLGGSLSFSCPLQLYLVLMFLGKTVLSRLSGYFQCFIIWGVKACFHGSLLTLRRLPVMFNASNILLSDYIPIINVWFFSPVQDCLLISGTCTSRECDDIAQRKGKSNKPRWTLLKLPSPVSLSFSLSLFFFHTHTEQGLTWKTICITCIHLIQNFGHRKHTKWSLDVSRGRPSSFKVILTILISLISLINHLQVSYQQTETNLIFQYW